ncbi:SDR family oxidoreductase [Sphingomonas sp. CROZ-RG-20F-R02-07]|uniref:SDR family NAD(P)-dependent oxidoreductase n=1 Tax=Sphingomonas sp. CROZ-RG-20F-R02-07 TaxID=2914832 RepID=UPI001F56BEDD|nr:SDR family oxidoreductase [Sphingomonas sp. CROZ-RG-20F-R02-07]
MPETSRIAIVTGGSRGLGRNAVTALARTGVDSIVTYHSNRDEADAAVREVETAGSKAVALQLDVGQAERFPAFVEQVKAALGEHWGRDTFDFLVNNAGTSHFGKIGEVTEADFDDIVAVQLKGAFFLTQALLPLIADGGRIVNLSSGLARFATPGFAAYAMMKGGIEVFTRYLAKELGGRGITANTVAPGAIETDFAGGMVRDNPQMNKGVADATALGRAGVPDDVGPMIAALLGDANRWVNAQRIEVSGGAYL